MGGRGRSSKFKNPAHDFYDADEKMIDDFMGFKNGGQTDKWMGSLYDEEKKSIKAYTSSNYADINNGLRNGKTTSQTENIDSALDKYDLKSKIVVHRSDTGGLLFGPIKMEIHKDDTGGFIFRPEIDINNLFSEIKVGKNSVVKSYVSTAVSSSSYTGMFKYNITVPPGRRGAYVKGLSSYSEENEFLLKRNTKFKITGKRLESEKLYIDLEVID